MVAKGMATIEQLQVAFSNLIAQNAAMSEMMKTYFEKKMESGEAVKQKKWSNMEMFRNIKPFTGDQGEWMEFSFKIRSQVGAIDGVAAQIMDFVESKLTEAELEDEIDDPTVEVNGEEVDDKVLKDVSGKMFNVLMNLTTGEANAVVRRCPKRNGLLAWKRLCTTLNPRTLAAGVELMSQVLNPQKINDARKADSAIEMWDDKLTRLKTEYGEELSYKVRLAILYSMLPKDLQERTLDKCAVNWDGTKEPEAMTVLGKSRRRSRTSRNHAVM